MSYEHCEKHDQPATNGCRLCKCPECGAPEYCHGTFECLAQQHRNTLEAGAQLWRALAKVQADKEAWREAAIELLKQLPAGKP